VVGSKANKMESDRRVRPPALWLGGWVGGLGGRLVFWGVAGWVCCGWWVGRLGVQGWWVSVCSALSPEDCCGWIDLGRALSHGCPLAAAPQT
jgi:hypothetical protein